MRRAPQVARGETTSNPNDDFVPIVSDDTTRIEVAELPIESPIREISTWNAGRGLALAQ
jgi:hypothetical protein